MAKNMLVVEAWSERKRYVQMKIKNFFGLLGPEPLQKVLRTLTLREVNAFIVASYAIALLYLYSGPSAVPDEYWFLSVAHNLQADKPASFWVLSIFTQINELGYGALYWLLYRFCFLLTEAPFHAMRYICIALFASIPLSFMYGGSKEKQQTLGLMLSFLWLSFPAAWWTGKITGPEPLSMALMAFGLARLRRHGRQGWLGWSLLGVSCGVKITCIPGFIFAVLASFRFQRSSFRPALTAAFFGIAGFLFANPFVVLNRRPTFCHTLRQFSRPHSLANAVASVPNLFVKEAWEWDLLPSNGFFLWGMGAYVFITFVALTVSSFLSISTSMPLWIAFFLSTFMIASNYNFLGWYWFPTLILLVGSLMWGDGKSHRYLALIGLMATANLCFQMHTIVFNIEMKHVHDLLLSRRDDIQQQLDLFLTNESPQDFVFDLSDLDLNLSFKMLPKKNKDKFTYIEPKWASHYASRMSNAPSLCGQGILLSGPRFKKHPAIGQVTRWLPKVYPEMHIVNYAETIGDFDIFRLLGAECLKKGAD